MTPTDNSFPPRLHVLLAKDTTDAVVIRRGPSKQVCTIGWNREDDSFTVGQWLKGRIYERRSDLSPDGRHLIYFAMNGRWKSEAKGSWTAISRAPYLKAIGFWIKGDGWHGGGLFLDKKRYWLNDGYGHEQRDLPPVLQRVTEHPHKYYFGGECPGVYYIRLQRDGWELKEDETTEEYPDFVIFEKRVNDHWTLRKRAYATIDSPKGKGCYYDEHELENRRTGEKIDASNWEWAEVDRHRLVWAKNGKLFAGRLDSKGLGAVTELYDFNSMEFEPISAPY